jgi:hypothetical protein
MRCGDFAFCMYLVRAKIKYFLNRTADVLFRLYNYNATTKEVYMQKHRNEENLWKKHRSY